MSDLESRKRALITECELSREALKADVANLKAYTSGFFKTIDRVRGVSPWILMALPLLIPVLRLFRGAKAEAPSKASPLKGRLAKLMLGFRLYRQYAPVVRSLIQQFRARRSPAPGRATSRQV